MLSNKAPNNEWHNVIALVLISCAFKLIFIPQTVWTDSDAVSRYLMTRDLQADWHVISTGNWPPLYFYLHAALFSLSPEWISPLVWQIVFAAISTWFVFAALRRVFSYAPAFGSTLLFALQPLLWRLSLQNMSETSAIMFVCIAVYFLIKAIQTSSRTPLLIAALIMAVATGIRYEAAFIAAFAGIFLWRNVSFKMAAIFSVTSSIFLLYWFTSNYLIWHEPLYSLQWSAQAISNNTIDNAEALVRRIGWFPLMLLLCIGPAGIVLLVRSRKQWTTSLAWKKFGWMPLTYLVISVIMCVAGSLLLQARFAVFTWLLCLPLFAAALESFKEKAIPYAALWSSFAMLFTFIYSTKSLQPIPQWNNPEGEKLAAAMHENLTHQQGFIHEFFDWETSYHLIYASGCTNKDLLFLQPDGTIAAGHTIDAFLASHSSCIAVVNTGSVFHENLIAAAQKAKLTVQEKSSLAAQTLLEIGETRH